MRRWEILLIGGSSASGKSTLARELSNYYKIPLLELDDIRIALQQIVDKKSHPDLYFFLDNPNFLIDFEAKILLDNLAKVSKEVWPSLKALIEKHIACDEPVIIEGDSVDPNLIKEITDDKVKALFLYASKDIIAERVKKGSHVPILNDKQLEFSFGHNESLIKQARENDLAILNINPEETLVERARQLLD